MIDADASTSSTPSASIPPQSERAAFRHEYASFGIRLAARFIDLIVTGAISMLVGVAVMWIIAIVLSARGALTESAIARLQTNDIATYALSMLATISYYVVATAVHGSTPGKMALGLTVLREDGGFCGIGAALVREIALFVDGLFFGIPAYVSINGSLMGQRYGDRWAHTVVVLRRSLGVEQRRSRLRFVAANVLACIVFGAVVAVSLLLKMTG